MRTRRNFWPFDDSEEDEIYDNPSWDMPGLKRRGACKRRRHRPDARRLNA